MRRLQSLKKQAGLTLVELMIAITLGMILTYGVIEIYASSKQTYRTQDGLSRMQESARFALDFIARDIRNSGYIGCGNLSNITPRIATTTPVISAYELTTVLRGHQNTGTQNWAPALPGSVTSVVNDTDVISITGAGRCSTVLASDMTALNSNVDIDNSNECGFAQGDVVLISNCTSADIFRITNNPTTDGHLAHTPLQAIYTTTSAAEVMTYSSNTYFIRNDAVSGLPSLFVLDNSQATGANNPIALIEGVENLQLLYGVDGNSDGVPDQYTNANSVTNWTNVVAVRIALLMRTGENVEGDEYEYKLGGTDVTYVAGPLRKEFIATVQLRNRGL